jgi:hypothetical protein
MLKDQKFASPDKSGRKSKWSKEVDNLNLDYLFSKYYIKEKKHIGKFISKIQGTCNHLIHAYSGMRKQEVFSLKDDCYKEENINGSICRLFGVTTKMHGKLKEEYWVTSREIKKVLFILNGINSVIAKHHKIKSGSLPLFVGTSMIKSNSIRGKIVAKYSFHDDEELHLDEKLFIISSQDKQEVEEIDFNRNYQEIEIGKKWQLTTHQYRRSLAVYSIQSGLVTLGALQIQMKHLFREMTLYYSNGASFAKKLFDTSKDHISKDIETNSTPAYTLDNLKDVYKDTVVLCKQIFRIPITSSHMIAPGGTIILTNSAIDHTINGAHEFNLLNADYEAKDVTGKTVNNSATPALDLIFSNLTNFSKMNLLNSGPNGIIIFRTKENVADFKTTYPYGKTKGNLYSLVPKKYVIDGVDILKYSATGVDLATKHMSEDIDGGYTNINAISGYNGEVIYRKTSTRRGTNGHKILQDSNNSINDFQTSTTINIREYDE